MNLTPQQQTNLETMFLDAIDAYLNPFVEYDRAANKMVADNMRAVLIALDFPAENINFLINKARARNAKNE